MEYNFLSPNCGLKLCLGTAFFEKGYSTIVSKSANKGYLHQEVAEIFV